MLLSPAPTDKLAGVVGLAMGEDKRKAKGFRERYALAPSPAFGTLSHKWERGL